MSRQVVVALALGFGLEWFAEKFFFLMQYELAID
jgi:hypothetical protein